MISYAPFFKTLKDRGITQYELLHMGVSGRLISSIKNNKSITASSINKLCMLLKCTPN
ncbi:MAG: helix-turn-helix domain-containing protein, partial [Oscillospiraceae bacterium]|nr:helix-turn-helix domain-containing protein [Oscillospiraceae bacterium]